MKDVSLAIIIFVLFMSVACRISNRSVVGTWYSTSDSLSFNKDKSFVLESRQGTYTGTWLVSGRSVIMSFKEEVGKKAFGNSDGLTNRITSFSRYRLVRPPKYSFPGNRFVSFRKLR